MLKTMREGGAYFIKGVMLFVVVTFIGTIFVVWGVKSTPGGPGDRGLVAVVGDTQITAEEFQGLLRRQVEMYKQLFGDKFDEKLLASVNIKQQVLDRMIRRALVLQYAERAGIATGPEELVVEIQRFPAFHDKDGSFSKQRYLDVLRANRLPAERFEADLQRDLTERKVEGLIRESVKVSDGEAREAFRQARRQLTVEVAQLPTGDEGRKKAEVITLATGKGKSLKEASQEAGVAVKQFGPFPASIPPKEIPDPEPFRQAAYQLRPNETSPLVSGQQAFYLLRLVSQDDPPSADFEKDLANYRLQYLYGKREAVLTDWVNQLRQMVKVNVLAENL
jgi:hypothetical protein